MSENLIAGKYTPDRVNHPSHYNSGKIEVIEFIEDQDLNFSRGNAVKYVSRAGKKGGTLKKEIEDLKKAAWYIKREIEVLTAELNNEEPKRPNEMNEATKKVVNENAKEAEKNPHKDVVGMDVMYHENGVTARAKHYEKGWVSVSFKEFPRGTVRVFHPSLGDNGHIDVIDSKRFDKLPSHGIFSNTYDKIRFFQHPSEQEFIKAKGLLKKGGKIVNGANNGSYKRVNGDIQLVMDK